MASIPLPALSIRPPENPLDQYAKALSVKSMIQGQQLQQQQIQGAQLENQNTQQAITDRNAMTKSMSEWDGKDMNDLPAIVLKNGGSANAVFGVRKQLLDQKTALSKIALDDSTTQKNNLDAMKTRNDQIAGSLESLVDPSAVKDENLHQEATRAVNGLLANNYIDKDHAVQLQSTIDTTKDQNELRTQIDHYAKLHMGASQLADEQQKEVNTLKTRIETQTAPYKEVPGTGMFFNVLTGETKTPTGVVMSPGMMESKYVVIQQRQAQGQPISPEDQAFSKGYEKFKTLVPQFNIAMQNGLLKNSAMEMAAENYFQTGQMPNGMRSPAMSAAIINKAAELHPDATKDLAGNRVAFKANQSSLESIQKNFDQVTAFENTAGKNLDTFLGVAQKVIDSGSPLVNAPLREAVSKLAGSPDQAAFEAARTTALTEIAKVLNSSNASGVLSDSARSEVGQLIGPNASLRQIVSAANILKQDMGNRHEAYQYQINDIKGRLGGAGAQTTGAGTLTAKPVAPSGKTVVYDPSGSPHAIFSNKVDDFLKDPQYKGWHQ
jgi:hypothetical protein